jgi:hypothetical protein
VRQAINVAIDRGHNEIEPADLITARERYSAWVFDAILKEDDPRKEKLESVLYEFAGADNNLEKKEIEQRMASADVAGDDVEFYIDLLCDIGFLRVLTPTGFRLPPHERERRTMREVARQIALSRDGDEAFEINTAFHWILQITERSEG